MGEHTRPDGNDLERAPEEAAIEAWLEESGVDLKIPPSVRADFEHRCKPASPVGASPLARVGARIDRKSVRGDFARRRWI